MKKYIAELSSLAAIAVTSFWLGIGAALEGANKTAIAAAVLVVVALAAGGIVAFFVSFNGDGTPRVSGSKP